MRAQSEVRYHYTTGYWARLIVEDGEIKMTNIRVSPQERPVVWFSVNPTWDGNADKGREDSGMRGSAETGGGIYRFAVAPETAPHNWNEFVRLSGVSEKRARMLCRAAKEMNASHRQFFVSFEPVTADKWLAIETFNFEAGRWVPADLVKMPSVEISRDFLELQGRLKPV